MRSSLSTILLVLFSGFIFVFLIIIAIFMLMVGTIEVLPQTLQYSSQGQTFLRALNLMFIGLLILPMVYYNFRHLLGKPETNVESKNYPNWLICILSAIWLLFVLNMDAIVEIRGDWIRISEFPLQIISVVLPIIIILWISLRGIPVGTKRRIWTIFGLGLVLGPLIILMSELTILLLLTFVMVYYFTKSSSINHELTVFFNQMAGNNSIEGIQERLIPNLTNPRVIVTILLFVSLIVPIIEEFLKPAGTWLAIKKNMKPQDGFVMGILSGAGYALFETLSLSGGMRNGWGAILLGRAGTDLLHIFNTGLIGWALVSDWKLKGWLKLIGVYILSIMIHGLWNGFSLTLGLNSFLKEIEGGYSWLKYSGNGAAAGLIILSLIMIFGLWVINNKLRTEAIKDLIDV